MERRWEREDESLRSLRMDSSCDFFQLIEFTLTDESMTVLQTYFFFRRFLQILLTFIDFTSFTDFLITV